MPPGATGRSAIRRPPALAGLVLLAALVAGCQGGHGSGDTGSAGKGGTSASPTAGRSPGDGGAAEMEKKLDAAESAAADADKDAASGD
ncbi:hypothetical protein [Streptomyces fuscigenes]|uniref:hypothetical protein n=1 Tax=Streptomyces fuscigenes TaxID=1528880 RepID=UPI001F200C44|nr:hypothetical protein [Streptomyces fuscigenes]MCF3965527.1 hypothetical protein [Streptomyces fuscigenes]